MEGVTVERASELGWLKSKWEEMDKAQDENVYTSARRRSRRAKRSGMLTAGE